MFGMEVIDLPLDLITASPWNPNEMDQAMLSRLRASIQRFGLVVPLVVRPIGDLYETIGGAQRLNTLRQLGIASAPCVIVKADDANAQLLAQALNRIQGEDNPGLKAELIRQVLQQIPQDEVLSLLPETAASLTALSSLGQQDLAEHIQSWQRVHAARLKHPTFQFTPDQLEVVEVALAQARPHSIEIASGDNPNPRGNALYLLCKNYLELLGGGS